MRLLTLLVFSLSLTACGFQLRGTGGFELQAESVSVVADNSHSDLAAELIDTLEGSGVEVNLSSKPQYSIRVGSESTTRRAVASSGSITVSEYEVQVSINFSVVNAKSIVIIPSTALSVERIYSFDASNFVSNSEEEAVLVEEMRRDLAGQIVRRFSATLRNQNAVSGDSRP